MLALGGYKGNVGGIGESKNRGVTVPIGVSL